MGKMHFLRAVKYGDLFRTEFLLALLVFISVFEHSSAAIRCASTKDVAAGAAYGSADDQLRQIALTGYVLFGRPETGGYASRYDGVSIGGYDDDYRKPQPSKYDDDGDDGDYRGSRRRPYNDDKRDDEELDFKPIPESSPQNYRNSSVYDGDDYEDRRRYRQRPSYEGPYILPPPQAIPYDRPPPMRQEPHYQVARRPESYYQPPRDDLYYPRPPPERTTQPPAPPKIYERDKADMEDDRRQGRGHPIYEEEGDYDNCPIETRETISNNTDLPLTSASAIISTPIGDFIMYCAQAPAKAILTYPLYCTGTGDQSVGKDVLYTAIDHNCFDLRVVDDRVNPENPTPMVIALSRDEFSTVYRVDYDMNQFRLQPCKHVIEHKYITDVAVMLVPGYGALLAFSNNDPRPGVEYQETLAPLFLAHAGDISLCGYADLQHTTDVAVTRRKNEIILAYLQRVGNTRRTIIYLNELVIRNGKCDVKPRRIQSTIGSAPYRGERNSLGVSEPFTIDQVICGGEDIQFLTAPQKRNAIHLAIAISNTAKQEHGVGCPPEEKVCPDGDMDKCFCGCVHANRRSLVLAYRPQTKIFDFLYDDETALQELITSGPESVTEITHLPTENCCLVFQTISPLGATDLYTIEYDVNRKLRVYRFYKHGLPFYAERSSFGYCNNNDLIISYTIHNYQSENSVFHLHCNRNQEKRNYKSQNERYSQDFTSSRYPSSYYQDRMMNRTAQYLPPQNQPNYQYNPAMPQQVVYGRVYEDTYNNSMSRPVQSQNRTSPYMSAPEERPVVNFNRTSPYGAPPYQNQQVKPLYTQPVYSQPQGYPQAPISGYPMQYQG